MLGLAIAFGLGGQNLARKALERYFGDAKRIEQRTKTSVVVTLTDVPIRLLTLSL